jgi:type II secretory pathway pseudopilin PulG
MRKCGFYSQSGQALLIVVLVMVIVLTIGLAVASKSIVSMRTSTEQSESQKALSAAEAGIEQVLKSSVDIPIKQGTLGNDATFNANVAIVKGTKFNLNGGNIIAKNEGFDLWLSDYSTDPAMIYLHPISGTFIIRWGDSPEDCNNAALEIVALSSPTTGSKDDAVLTRYAVDPCSARNSLNHFTAVLQSQGEIDGKKYYYASSIVIQNGFLVRIIPLYHSSSIGVDGGATALPSQGSVIESTGISNESTRKVTVFRGFPRIPAELFPYSLFTP